LQAKEASICHEHSLIDLYNWKKDYGKLAISIVYVNAIIALGDALEKMNRLKEALVPKFEIKDLGSF